MSKHSWASGPIEVMKFGGTSVKDIDRIKSVADRILESRHLGKRVVVVVSAMAGVTNSLVGYCSEIAPKLGDSHLERDGVLSSGEQITSALLALRLNELDVSARSMQGWQVPIIVDRKTGGISITQESIKWLTERLNLGEVLVVSGFQGIDINGQIATLGRGGSDATAVILAAALKADYCNIYTDVDGIYSADPRVVDEAKPVKTVGYGEMLELSASGAKVMQSHSVALAMQHGVALRVCSSLKQGEVAGSVITAKDNFKMERSCVTGVASVSNQVKVRFAELSNEQVTGLLNSATELGIASDVNHIESNKHLHSVSLCFREDLLQLVEDTLLKINNLKPSEVHKGLSKVSIIGVGISSHPNILNTALLAISELKSQLYGLSANEMRITFLVENSVSNAVTNKLHNAFGLQASKNTL